METYEENGTSRLAKWGPYLGALGIALVAAAFFLGAVLSMRRDVLLAMAVVGIGLLVFYILTLPRGQLRGAVTGRTTIYGSNALIMSLAFIGIVVIINFLAGRQLHGRYDATASKQFTLSQQTIQVVQKLPDPVQIIGFFVMPDYASQQSDAQNLLKEYQQHTDKLNVQFIDPVANPAAARQYDIQQPDTLVFVHGSRNEKIYQFDESSITNAILKVTQANQPAIYFTTGHGEEDPTDFSGQTGLGNAGNYLTQVNYKVATVNLATISSTTTISGGLPADTAALVIASPQKPFSSQDEQRVKAYLNGGGRVLLMVDPQFDPGLKDLLGSWGLALNNDLVLDPAQNYRGNAVIPVFLTFPSSDIATNLQKYGVFLPAPRSISETTGANIPAGIALFTTSADACAKTDFTALTGQTQLQCDYNKDKKGAYVLGYSVEQSSGAGASGKAGRLVVVGTSQFITNQTVNNQDSAGNQLLFQNIINWLAGQENLIAIPAKAQDTRNFNVLTNEDSALIEWSSKALVPVLVLVIGGLIWWRRRA